MKVNYMGGFTYMSLNDFIKYLTQQFVTYWDKPKDQRLQMKKNRKSAQPPVLSRWFGILPLGFMLYVKREKNKKGKL
jgi:hypothetical protein